MQNSRWALFKTEDEPVPDVMLELMDAKMFVCTLLTKESSISRPLKQRKQSWEIPFERMLFKIELSIALILLNP